MSAACFDECAHVHVPNKPTHPTPTTPDNNNNRSKPHPPSSTSSTTTSGGANASTPFAALLSSAREMGPGQGPPLVPPRGSAFYRVLQASSGVDAFGSCVGGGAGRRRWWWVWSVALTLTHHLIVYTL